jgi:hypothetical protein
MIKKGIGYLALFVGSFAIMVSSVMLLFTIIVPFIGESFVDSRGITAAAIMETGEITLEYYSYTIGMLLVMLALGILSASLGRYVIDLLER